MIPPPAEFAPVVDGFDPALGGLLFGAVLVGHVVFDLQHEGDVVLQPHEVVRDEMAYTMPGSSCAKATVVKGKLGTTASTTETIRRIVNFLAYLSTQATRTALSIVRTRRR